ncbi:SDR family NAD(P)-dependent oxidoreductase [Roseobacter ponti]|uniref:SDR family oxidoreductase n=1 Tax=Roseobacter ponti TaxID=1891787 RepID=A0A858SS59_9RHOB|nr:SDR family oxidoreductase [Roseobacter ponti]QJF51544.1 SDR family oxidoreductase [Roseobacter ponti]
MRAALVTGAARGLGRAMAADLARDHLVAVTYNTTEPGPLLAEHPGIFAVRADLSEPVVAQSVIDQVIDRFGRLDVLVNNAGVIRPDPGADDGLAGLREIFDVNVLAPMALLQAALPHLKPGASVVSISSTNAVLPARGASGYSASKAALNTWTRAMAKELGPRGIRVNAVAPGATERPESPRPDDLVQVFVEMTALGRIGQPEDIAAAVRFLASDPAGFITGEVLNVNGGYRL